MLYRTEIQIPNAKQELINRLRSSSWMRKVKSVINQFNGINGIRNVTCISSIAVWRYASGFGAWTISARSRIAKHSFHSRGFEPLGRTSHAAPPWQTKKATRQRAQYQQLQFRRSYGRYSRWAQRKIIFVLCERYNTAASRTQNKLQMELCLIDLPIIRRHWG